MRPTKRLSGGRRGAKPPAPEGLASHDTAPDDTARYAAIVALHAEKCQTENEAPAPLLVAGWVDFLGRWQWDWFCTLTFRGAVHPEAADKRFRMFVSKINRRLYGPRWHKHNEGAYWARALEMQRREVIHYHALLGGAGVAELHRLSWMDEWNKLAGFARIEVPRSTELVKRYCAKYVVKGGEIDIGGVLIRKLQLRLL